MSNPPESGSTAPDFTLPGSRGGEASLGNLQGKWVVLYFYPKDDTPGCTVEACGFRDNIAPLQAAGAVVLGVSKDSLRSHAKFAAKFDLPFELLADTDHAVAERYGSWGEKSFMGRKTIGMLRTTVLIDPEGRVACVWSRVKPEGHALEVLDEIRRRS